MAQRLLFLTSSFNDIRVNLALEDILFKKYNTIHKLYNINENPLILFLWRNTPSVIIGRYQNPFTECNVDNIKKDDVKLVRRMTGGGAVYQDLGNTCFSFLSHSNDYSVERNNELILKALESFGIKGSPHGRNDLVCDGKKFSGSAFKNIGTTCLHHGTLLFNVNIANMLKYLTPDISKLQHGVKSVESRTVNLSTLEPKLSHESFLEAVLRTAGDLNGIAAVAELSDLPEDSELFVKLNDDSWNYGDNKEYELVYKNRFTWGSLEVQVSLEHSQVIDVNIYSDSLDLSFIEELQKYLNSQTDELKLNEYQQWSEVKNWLLEVKFPYRRPQVD